MAHSMSYYYGTHHDIMSHNYGTQQKTNYLSKCSTTVKETVLCPPYEVPNTDN